MSRIGKKPVAVPKGVTANVEGQTVTAKGPKGQLAVVLVEQVGAEILFEGCDLPAQRGLREVKLLGSASEVSEFSHLDEAA